jgi:DNA replication protein DnaC
MIITSNKKVSEWATLLGDEILAAAILDRLLHDAEVLTINGPSYRLRGRTDILKDTAPPDSNEPDQPEDAR